MAQTKPKAGQFYGVSNNGTDGQFLKTDGTGGMSWDSPITNPTITSIDYPGSTTAADPAGGQSVIINGTLFASGITCTVGGTSAVTAFNSATQITITTPAKAAGPYAVAVANLNGGTASETNFIQYSGVPVWSTAAGTLGNVLEGAAASFQVTATEGSDTIEYAVTTGTLPTGLSLATATGAITGTAPTVSADTTTTFSITATDDENQTSASRSFSITVQNDNPSNYFNTVLYTGSNAPKTVTGTGFESDFIWIKDRTDSTANHYLIDSVRGIGSGGTYKFLSSDLTTAENTTSTNHVSAINNNGFILQGNHKRTNAVGKDYVAWNFKAGGAAVANTDGTINSQVSVNNTLGFSIVKHTGTGSTGTVGTGLSSTAELIIRKNLDASSTGSDWYVYAPASPYFGYLQATDAFQSNNNAAYSYNQTVPTGSIFNVGNTYSGNINNDNYIAYCFTSKPGFSKVGSYTGARPNDVLVQTGFQPAFVMIKASNATDDWFIVDDKREGTSAPTKNLLANTSGAESSFTGVQFLANGFKLVGSANSGGTNNSGTTFIYLAIAADGSTATPSLANSFSTITYSGDGGTQSITGTGFKPDFIWGKTRNAAQGGFFVDSVRGRNNSLLPYSTSPDNPNSAATNDLISFDSNGFTVGPVQQTFLNSGYNQVAWLWKAGGTPSINTDGTTTSIVSANQAAGFSIVKWVGTRPSSDTIGHGLGLTPKMIIIKNSSISSDWTVYVESEGATKHGILDTAGIWVSNAGAFNNTSPTSSVFTVGGDAYTNGTGNNIIAYCFADISGYSKVGSYVGGGNTNPTINVGFAPDWIMVKRTTGGNGGWTMVDNKRHPGTPTYVNGNVLYADETLAEQDNNNIRGFVITSTGFTPNGNYPYTNNSGDSYIYLAIKEN